MIAKELTERLLIIEEEMSGLDLSTPYAKKKLEDYRIELDKIEFAKECMEILMKELINEQAS